MEVVEEDAINSEAAISLPTSDLAYRPSPECPRQQETSSTADLMTMPEPTTKSDP